MKELSHRRDVELARCKAALLSAHAQLCQTIATRLSDRIEPQRLVELYSRAQELAPLDEAWVRVHTLAHSTDAAEAHEHGGHDDRSHAWESVRDALRARLAPTGDPAMKEALTYELARADVILLKVHVRSAVTFAEALATWLAPPRAVLQYIDRMDVPASIAGAVYCLAVAKLATTHEAPRLTPSPAHRLAPYGS